MDLPGMRREAKQTITLMTMMSPKLLRGCVSYDYPTQLLQSLFFIIQLSLQFQTVRQSKSCWVYIYASLSKSIQGPVEKRSLWVHREANRNHLGHIYRFFFHLKTFKVSEICQWTDLKHQMFLFPFISHPTIFRNFWRLRSKTYESLA